jgi:hypothetical protein
VVDNILHFIFVYLFHLNWMKLVKIIINQINFMKYKFFLDFMLQDLYIKCVKPHALVILL